MWSADIYKLVYYSLSISFGNILEPPTIKINCECYFLLWVGLPYESSPSSMGLEYIDDQIPMSMRNLFCDVCPVWISTWFSWFPRFFGDLSGFVKRSMAFLLESSSQILSFFFSSARNARRVAFRLEVFAALNAKWVIRQKPFGILAAGGWNDEVCRKWRRTCGDFVLMYVIPSGEMRVYVLSFCIVMFVWILKNNLKS